MQRLTYPRTLSVPLAPNARDQILEFYRAAPRRWQADLDACAPFQLKLYRGNWGVSKWSQWLGRFGLEKYVRKRQALAPSFDGAKSLFDSWPAELTIALKPKTEEFELSLVYEVTMIGGNHVMSRTEKKKYKDGIENDVAELREYLQPAKSRD